MSEYVFGVVVDTGPVGKNRYHEVGMKVTDQGDPAIDIVAPDEEGFDVKIITQETAITVLMPAWKLGEIVVFHPSTGRTIPDGRAPWKWYVKLEEFDCIEDAVKRAEEI